MIRNLERILGHYGDEKETDLEKIYDLIQSNISELKRNVLGRDY